MQKKLIFLVFLTVIIIIITVLIFHNSNDINSKNQINTIEQEQTSVGEQEQTSVEKTTKSSEKVSSSMKALPTDEKIDSGITDIKILDIFLYVSISLLFLIVIFLIVRLTDILKLLDKSTTNISSLDSKIQNLDKKVSDTDENYNELKKSFQSADKENFNLIQFPLDLSEKIDKFTKTVIEYSKRVYQIVNVDQKEKIEEVNEAMKIFQETINSKSDELNKYKDGYDFSKKKNLIEGIIDNISRIDLYKSKLSNSDSQALESLEFIKVSLISLLNNNNVSQFDVPLGTNTLEHSDKCDVIPETVPHDDPSKIHTVESIVDNGYRVYIKEDEWKLIKKVKVRVYSNAQE